MAAGGIKVHVYGDYNDNDIKKAIKDLQSLQTQADGGQSGFKNLTSNLKSVAVAAGAFVALGAVTDFLRSSAEAAIVDEQSMVALSQAMRNMGVASKQTGVEKFISTMSLASGVADDELRPAFARLLRSTNDVTESQKALDTALNISKATGKSMDTVANALGKAYDGNAASLGRLGLGLDKATLKSGDMNVIMGELNAKFGGQWAAAADTYGGKMDRIKVAADEASETIGYALLGAVDGVSSAFGGTDGAVDAIGGFGDSIANMVTAIGGATTEIAKLVAAMNGAKDEGMDWGNVLQGAATGLGILIPPVAGLSFGLGALGDAGATVREVTEAQTAALAAQAGRYEGMAAAMRPAAIALKEQEDATLAAKAATDALKASQEALERSLSKAEGRLSWLRWLRDLGTELDGNKRSFDGWGKSARENQDKLLEGLGMAETRVKSWKKTTIDAAGGFEAAWAGEGAKVVRQFIAEGFTLADIKKFLKANGLWTKELQAIFYPAKNKSAYDEADRLGFGAGKNVSAGIARGISAGNSGVVTAVSAVVQGAINKANAMLEINSPSKVFYRMGQSVDEGLAGGITADTGNVIGAAGSMVGAMSDAALDKIDAARTAALDRAKQGLADAKQAYKDFADGISSSIMGGLDLGAAVSTAAEAGVSVVDALNAQATQGGKFAQNLIDLTKTSLSEEAWSAVAALGAERGLALTDALLGPAGPAMITKLNKIYADMDVMATAAGAAAAAKWRQQGVDQAQALYNGMHDNLKPGGPARVAMEKLHDSVARSLDRTSYITVKTVYEAAGISGERALGGSVGAKQAYLVGEKGPEVFVPYSNGTIIPNGGSLPSGTGSFGATTSTSGNTYQISISAGVGDPRQIGQQVVEYIRKFESASGPVFAPAS